MEVRPLLAAWLYAPAFVLTADPVTLYIWEDFIADEVIEAFTAETGLGVDVMVFDDEDTRDSVITSGRGKGFDLVLVESVSLQILAEQGHMQRLNAAIAPLADHLDPRWRQSCGDYGVPYAWGTTGILHRTSVSTTPITSWRQLFKPPAEHRGRVVMYMDMVDAPGAALLASGASPFAEDPGALKQAFALFKAQQPYLLAKEYGFAYGLEHKARSRMSLTFGYAGDEYLLAEQTGQDDWVYVVPEEGSSLWGECLAAPSGKPVDEATRAFLAFLNRPDVAALNAESVWFATPNQAARQLASDEYLQDESLFPPPAVLARSLPYQRLSAETLRLRGRMLSRLK